jgi:L-threonylcarbamoyladenylate synthase
MTIVAVDPERPEGPALQRAASILRAGGLVAFPTETVYGLGANALDEAAVRRIFAAKGRPAYNPLIVHVAERDEASALVVRWTADADRLAERFWPGPLTLVLPKRAAVPDIVTAGLDTVAVRVPGHPVALALLRAARVPLAAPSANPFTRLSPTTAEHVEAGLGDAVDLILDAGPTFVGIESTVIDLSGECPRLLRPGTISRAEIESVVGPMIVEAPAEAPPDEAARRSPGMVRRHYAPQARLRIFEGGERQSMAAAARQAAAEGQRVGGLLLHPLDAPLSHSILMPGTPSGFAARLYSALHELDDAGCSVVLADAVPHEPQWAGVRDRLTRGSHAE